jgi:hypothetical protein
MYFRDLKEETFKGELLRNFVNNHYKGDLAYFIADNPFILEAIEDALLKEFPEILET